MERAIDAERSQLASHEPSSVVPEMAAEVGMLRAEAKSLSADVERLTTQVGLLTTQVEANVDAQAVTL